MDVHSRAVPVVYPLWNAERVSRAVSANRTPSRRQARAWSHEGTSATLRFAVAFGLTAAYVAFAVWAASPWRAELRDAIGPVMAWVIPTFLAYVPAVLVGFMVFTLLTLRYRVPSLDPPSGPWPEGSWPPVTVVIAARDEESTIGPTLERIADLSYGGPLTAILADNNSTDRTAKVAEQTARHRGLAGRRGCWRAFSAIRPPSSRESWPDSSAGSTTSCRFSTSGRSGTSFVASDSIPGATSWAFAATCSAIGR